MSLQAQTKGTATRVDLPNGDRFLLVEITTDCPACGPQACPHCGAPQTIRLAGHHLRAVRDLMIEFIDLHPELTGKDGDIHTIERLQMQGRSDGTPENN